MSEDELKDLVIQEKYEDDDFEQVESDDLSSVKHAPLTDADQFIDIDKGVLIDKSKLSPFEQIKVAAQQSGTELRKPNSGCKHCYGRGYTGTTLTGEPLACTCIFPPRTGQQLKQDLNMLSYMQAMKKKQKQVRNNLVNKAAVMVKDEFNKRVNVPEAETITGGISG